MNETKLSIFSRAAITCIRLYQRYFSPDHSLWAKAMNRPPYCKHVPSCSEYAVEAFEKKGFFVGLAKSAWRVLRCNPWSRWGYDPVEPIDWKSGGLQNKREFQKETEQKKSPDWTGDKNREANQ